MSFTVTVTIRAIPIPLIASGGALGRVALAVPARSLSGLILSSTRAHSDVDHISESFAREGGPEAGSVARRFWEAPTVDALRDYVSTCFPLFGLSSPDPDGARRTIVNADVLLRFCSQEHNTMDMRSGLSNITCPTLVLSGGRDPISPLEDVREMVAAIPEQLVSRELFRDQRHNLSKDHSEEYFSAIERWIAANAHLA